MELAERVYYGLDDANTKHLENFGGENSKEDITFENPENEIIQ
jgi:hypothetical protein